MRAVNYILHRLKIFTKELKFRMNMRDCVICTMGINAELGAVPSEPGSSIVCVVQDGGCWRNGTSPIQMLSGIMKIA